MSVVKRLQSLNLPNDAIVTLRFQEGADVVHYNETEIETAISETDVVQALATLVSNTRLDVRTRWAGNILEHLRNEEYLDDYERGSFTFGEYLADTIRNNFYDVELIDYSTEKYDHKRGYTTLTAEVDIPYSNFIDVDPTVSGWTVSVITENGRLTFEA